jgi:hypothetical protein
MHSIEFAGAVVSLLVFAFGLIKWVHRRFSRYDRRHWNRRQLVPHFIEAPAVAGMASIHFVQLPGGSIIPDRRRGERRRAGR